MRQMHARRICPMEEKSRNPQWFQYMTLVVNCRLNINNVRKPRLGGETMILVLFEVVVKKEGMQKYLSLAAGLKDELARAEGFIRAERFSSLSNEGKLLSLSVWENEEAVNRWRNTLNHRMSQKQGHDSLFDSYTITVASKIRSYTNVDRTETPQDSNKFLNLVSTQ